MELRGVDDLEPVGCWDCSSCSILRREESLRRRVPVKPMKCDGEGGGEKKDLARKMM